MARLLDEMGLRQFRLENKYSKVDRVYEGSPQKNLSAANMEPMADAKGKTGLKAEMDTLEYENSSLHSYVWNRLSDYRSRMVKNAAMLPDDWATMTDLIRIDISRRRMQEPDYTDLVGIEINRPEAGLSITLDEFLEWAAVFEPIGGNNDPLPLMEHKSGANTPLTFDLLGVADKTSLKEILFSSLYDLERRNRAVVRAYTGIRNDRNVLGRMVAKTTATGWAASQIVAADATAGATKEELLYNTIVAGLKTLFLLKDPQTKQTIATPDVFLMIPKGTEWSFMRAIGGQLNQGGKGKVGNFEALSQIGAIIPYRGDTIYWNKKTVTYLGPDVTYAYLFVPRVANYTVVKRGLTTVVGQGDVTKLEQNATAWYFCDKAYDTEFFGASASLTAGEGYCVRLTLPTL
jgi:hypothetical protein